MRIFRFCFRIVFVVLCLFAGICIADKEHYSNRVVGVCVATEQHDTPELQQLREFISDQSFQDANELYLLIGSRFSDQTNIHLGRQYFEQTDGFPGGVYDTVYVVFGNSQQARLQLLYATDDCMLPSALSDHYFAVLSFIGKIEKAVLDRFSSLDF